MRRRRQQQVLELRRVLFGLRDDAATEGRERFHDGVRDVQLRPDRPAVGDDRRAARGADRGERFGIAFDDPFDWDGIVHPPRTQLSP